MKKCPNCGELVGDSVSKCFNCFFDMTNPEANKLAEQHRKEKERERQRIAEENRIKEIRKKEEKIFSINSMYEYDIVSIPDLQTGETNLIMMKSVITQYAQKGWRVHTIYTNEIGKEAHPKPFGLVTINATIDQTIILFERIVADKDN